MIEIDHIYNEDCLEGMKRIDDGAVDCIITDLPYEVLHKDNPHAQWDKIIPIEPMWEQFLRISKPSAPIVLFAQGMLMARLMISQPKIWRYNIVWNKVRVTNFLNAKNQPLRIYENILVFYKDTCIYNPQMTKGSMHVRDFGKANVRRCYLDNVKHLQSHMSDEYYPKDIITFEKNALNDETLHPTQKPVDLLRYLILTYTNKGDTVLDATIGSGTTAVAALMEHRHFIGFETDKGYYDKAVERINELRRNPTLF